MIDIWQSWLASYGGAEYFLLAMIVFLGGYTLATWWLDPVHQGTRRALALAFLAVGLWIGHWVGHASLPSSAPVHVFPPPPPLPLPATPTKQIQATQWVAALITAGAAYAACRSWARGVRLALAGGTGFLFYHLAPPLTFPALLIWTGLVGWAVYALHQRESINRV